MKMQTHHSFGHIIWSPYFFECVWYSILRFVRKCLNHIKKWSESLEERVKYFRTIVTIENGVGCWDEWLQALHVVVHNEASKFENTNVHFEIISPHKKFTVSQKSPETATILHHWILRCFDDTDSIWVSGHEHTLHGFSYHYWWNVVTATHRYSAQPTIQHIVGQHGGENELWFDACHGAILWQPYDNSFARFRPRGMIISAISSSTSSLILIHIFCDLNIRSACMNRKLSPEEKLRLWIPQIWLMSLKMNILDILKTSSYKQNMPHRRIF